MKRKSPDIDSPIRISGSLLARNTFLNFIGYALPLLVGLATIPFVIRGLGADRFGILSLAWVVVGYFGFFDLGLGRATTKFVAEAFGKGESERVPEFFWTTAAFQTLLGFIGAVALGLSTPLLVEHVLKVPAGLIPETKSTFYVLAGSLPVIMVSASFRGILEASQRFDLVNIVKIPSSIVNFVLPLAGFLLGFRLPGIMILLVISRAVTLLVWILMCFRILPVLKEKITFRKRAVRPLLSFGSWVLVSDVVSPILVYIDRFFIGSILTVTAVGYYSAPFELVTRLGIIPSSLLMTLFPTFSAFKGRREQERIEAFFGSSLKYLLILIGLVMVVLQVFAKDVIGLWLGEDFVQHSLLAFQFLLLGFFMNSLANIPYSLLQGIGRADVTAKFHLLEVVFYIPLAWILIKNWGISGAAAAWTIRVTVDMILLFLAAWKIGGIKIQSPLKTEFLKGGAALLLYALAGYFIKNLPWGIFGFVPLSIGFVLAAWFFLLNPVERNWILAKSKQIIKRQGAET